MNGKKTYIGCVLLGIVGLAFGLRESVSWLNWLTPETFATIESIILAMTGVAMRAGVKKSERPSP